MDMSQEQFDSNVNDIKNSHDKRFLIGILEYRLSELRDQLEEPGAGEVPTSIVRGGILQIRELLDLIE